MKYLIIIPFVVLAIGCSAQRGVSLDSLTNIVKNINNSSVIIAYNQLETIHLDQKALLLCNNLSNSLATIMINELRDKEKALVIHVILSKSTEPVSARLKYEYHYTEDKIDYSTYTYNHFSWQQDTNSVIKIEEETVKNIFKYWNNKKGKFLIFHRCN